MVISFFKIPMNPLEIKVVIFYFQPAKFLSVSSPILRCLKTRPFILYASCFHPLRKKIFSFSSIL